jgi:hypothetical protein
LYGSNAVRALVGLEGIIPVARLRCTVEGQARILDEPRILQALDNARTYKVKNGWRLIVWMIAKESETFAATIESVSENKRKQTRNV